MDLEARLEALEARVTALEETDVVDRRWAAERLWNEFSAEGVRNGGVQLVGALKLPTGEQFDWQAEFELDAIVGDDWTEWTETANCLAALSNPSRLRLLREILNGRRTAADLAAISELGTSPEIYQHLRDLAAVGWLHTAGLGRFEVPEGRVVPLLVALACAQR
ncbi:ArsR/SmtB family transcription factor [Nocardia camponoti]|uniref:Transcriptional regulator n=1 Tax=Nocardia camponoti TaxID=1616106 RepID=A0A917QEF9_9NOCA|nr:winged helix-turn-helix domain-containing protein [Nocardia camponoti]GGK45116.1 transcriptional regulator [Nocardia camponoti]